MVLKLHQGTGERNATTARRSTSASRSGCDGGKHLGTHERSLAQDEDAKRLTLAEDVIPVAWGFCAHQVDGDGDWGVVGEPPAGSALTLDQRAHHTLQDSLAYLERKQNFTMSTERVRLRKRDGVRRGGGRPVHQTGTRSPVRRAAAEPVCVHPPDHETCSGVLSQLREHASWNGNLDRRARAGGTPGTWK